MMNIFWKYTKGSVDIVGALGKSFAIIEFDVDGYVINANPSFCTLMGYSIEELKSKHHRILVDSEYARSADYKAFWTRLRQGYHNSGEYRRLTREGREVWLQASYTPVLNRWGKVTKVVKLALDVTEAKIKSSEDASLLKAIFRSQAVIAFDLQGIILDANDNFLSTVGYTKDEVIGRKHAIFVEPNYAVSSEYEAFWAKLRRGEFFSEEFRRFGKGGREVWLQASYNPIFDANNKITKVVKFATDLTERMKGVAAVGGALAEFAKGDLMQRVHQPLIPSLDKLRVDFNAAAQALQDALVIVARSASSIHAGSEEISVSTDNLSRRTEQQAANLEQTAAALDEITATVRRTADGAVHARKIVATAKQEASDSEAVVRDAVDSMTRIEGSSNQISQIIGVIDEIAFQTNLLALNAGVEAARAGDAGRGFAVVASEVRALAQRSAEAAKEIKGLISASRQQVSAGVGLVGNAGQALARIARQVGEINSVTADIAASAQEQATGLNEVNAAVNKMDEMTQQNATMVEQTTAASHNLDHEAKELSRLILRFNIGQQGAAALTASPSRAVPSQGGLQALRRQPAAASGRR
jgi:methyl-accepting chemotaxis protein